MLPPDAQTRARSDRLGPRLRRSRARRRVRDAHERPPEESHPEHARRRPIGAREVLAAGSAGRGDATVGNSFRFIVVRRRGDGAFGLTSAPSAHFGRHTAMELEAAADVVDQQLRRFGLRMDAARCPRELEGRWRVDKANSQTLCPFVVGLGVPRFACPAIGLLERTTELTIRCTGPDDRAIRIEDKTAFSSRNVTEVTCDGVETEKASKTGRKRFYLSGATAPDSNTSVVKCRLHQRGEGWETRQERRAVGENRLRERNVLVRPGEEDVIVDRFFDRVEERKP